MTCVVTAWYSLFSYIDLMMMGRKQWYTWRYSHSTSDGVVMAWYIITEGISVFDGPYYISCVMCLPDIDIIVNSTCGKPTWQSCYWYVLFYDDDVRAACWCRFCCITFSTRIFPWPGYCYDVGGGIWRHWLIWPVLIPDIDEEQTWCVWRHWWWWPMTIDALPIIVIIDHWYVDVFPEWCVLLTFIIVVVDGSDTIDDLMMMIPFWWLITHSWHTI